MTWDWPPTYILALCAIQVIRGAVLSLRTDQERGGGDMFVCAPPYSLTLHYLQHELLYQEHAQGEDCIEMNRQSMIQLWAMHSHTLFFNPDLLNIVINARIVLCHPALK